MYLRTLAVLTIATALALPIACEEPRQGPPEVPPEEPEVEVARIWRTKLLAIGYSRGMLGGWGLTLLPDRRLLCDCKPAERLSVQLSSSEFEELSAYLASPEFAAATAELAKGEGPGLTDLPEVYLAVGEKELAFPVCRIGLEVSAPLRAVLDYINDLGHRHFGENYVPLPTVTCRPDFDSEDL